MVVGPRLGVTTISSGTIPGEALRERRDEGVGGAFHQGEYVGEPVGAAVVGVGHVLTGVDRVEVAEESYPLRSAAEVGQVVVVHGQHQVEPVGCGHVVLPRAVSGRVVPGPRQGGGGASVHRPPDVPVAGTAALHAHPVVQPCVAQPRLQDHVRGRRPADVAQTDHGDRVAPGTARGREPHYFLSSLSTEMEMNQFTKLITREPSRAFQKPSTWNPISNRPAIQAVSISISALITSRNSPSVSTMNGIEKNVTTGFTNELITPRISDTRSSGRILCLTSSQPDDGPVKKMPSISQVARATPAAVESSQVTKRTGRA